MKIKALGSLLAKQYGVAAGEGLAPGHPTLGDVTSPEELEATRRRSASYKAKLRAGNP